MLSFEENERKLEGEFERQSLNEFHNKQYEDAIKYCHEHKNISCKDCQNKDCYFRR